MKFRNLYINRPVCTPEKNSGEILIEAAGYISAERRITEMIQAGQRLADYRKMKYDSQNGEDVPLDPTRKAGFDLADAFRITEEAKLRMEYAKKASKKAVVESKKDSPTSDNPPIEGGVK